MLSTVDRAGSLRVRLNVRRNDYRVRPGLYAVGEPDDASPIIVTGNYKLTFDVVRAALAGRDLWVLVVDSHGVNVWCSAGKGVFSTAEVVRSVREARLEQVVSHTRLILPQLSATGVAGHDVRSQTGFSVVWGPVRVADLPAFMDAGMKAVPGMRRVEFPLAERAKLTGVELSVLWGREGAIGLVAALALIAGCALWVPAAVVPVLVLSACVVLGVVAGALVTPVLLPWLPGRAFSAKGAIAGLLLVAPVVGWAIASRPALPWAWGALAVGCALASFIAMNFTGSSTYTSPSGVEREMRRAIPLQLAGAAVGVAAFVIGLVVT
jgi:acetyl-CoA decarbonylase/synthase complex subunit gamma